MSIRINSPEPESAVPKTAAQSVGEGIGCVLQALAIALIWWALGGFPGLPK